MSNGNCRPYCEYCAVNTAIKPARYPIPHVQDFLDRLAAGTIFSKNDLVRAYHQIPVEPEDRGHTKDGNRHRVQFGIFEFRLMTYGLRNAARLFQRFMDEICCGLDFVFTYIDDMLLSSLTLDEHRDHLHQHFKRLELYGLVINTTKCDLGRPELSFLGHHISVQGTSPLPARVQAVADFPTC